MIPEIQRFFERYLAQAGADAAVDDPRLKLAAAALLEEAVHGERVCEPAEIDEVHLSIGQAFALPREQLEAVIELTEIEARRSVECCEFGDLIRSHYGGQHKACLAELLWRAVYAGDRYVDDFERDLVLKAAAMAGISEQALMDACRRVIGAIH